MKSRVVLLFIAFALSFAGVAARLFYLQCLPNSALERLKKSQYMTVVSLPPQRGKILDRKGAELATSVTAQSLYADPTMIDHPRRLARKLAPLLNIDAKELFSQLDNSNRKFVWLKRRLDPDVLEEVRSWDEPGLHFVEEGRRAYPNQNLLSQVLGFVGTDGGGLEGLEKKYDGELKGEKQSVLSRRDARGRPIVVSGQIFELHADGAELDTTIDKDLQYQLERELETVTNDQNADKATGVVMDPATGEILAMGTYPGFDPARWNAAGGETRRDRAIGDIYEPGSTFKVVMAAAALRTGRIQPNTKYFCENGKFKIGKHVIHEAESHGYGWLSLAEILAVSSNIGSTKVAFDVGQQGFFQMMRAMGFTQKTGVDLLGEAAGLVDDGPWPDHLFSNISFGHGVGVTALQMANAYSAIANGGRLMKPFLVKRVVDSDGHVVSEKEPEAIRQVLSPKEASTLTLMLSAATVEGGTGVMARVDGYPVAGKTGTAQKVDPDARGYLKKAYISSFAGFVPANNPQFTIYIAVDNPKKLHFGAEVAAPIFNHIASFALHQKGFMPIVATQAESKARSPATTMDPGARMKEEIQRALEENTMPDFRGLTLREAGGVLEELEKRDKGSSDGAELVGTGVAESQWPAPGAKRDKKKIKIIFRTSG